MIADALKVLFASNAEAKKAKVVKLPGDSERRVFVDKDGDFLEIPIEAPPRDSHVDSVDDLCRAALTYGNKERMSIWLTGEHAILVIDDDVRLDSVTLTLRPTAQWQTIKQLSQTPKVDQSRLISLLRSELPGAMARAEVLNVVRTLKFRHAADGFSNIQHGNESMGKSIENEVTGAGALPEEIGVIFALYDNPGEREKAYKIVLELDVLASEHKFRLKPTPATMEDAQSAALDSIRQEIMESLEGIRIFNGRP